MVGSKNTWIIRRTRQNQYWNEGDIVAVCKTKKQCQEWIKINGEHDYHYYPEILKEGRISKDDARKIKHIAMCD